VHFQLEETDRAGATCRGFSGPARLWYPRAGTGGRGEEDARG
jgi:hypothetical protein